MKGGEEGRTGEFQLEDGIAFEAELVEFGDGGYSLLSISDERSEEREDGMGEFVGLSGEGVEGGDGVV